MKPHTISSDSAHSDNCYFQFFHLLSDWVEILWGFMKFFFQKMLKISDFYLEKQKSFIPKRMFFKPLSISKQKSFVYWLNFPEGFDLHRPKLNVLISLHMFSSKYWNCCLVDTIEDHVTQIRRVWLGDLTILSNFRIKTSSLRSASDYELRLTVGVCKAVFIRK